MFLWIMFPWGITPDAIIEIRGKLINDLYKKKIPAENIMTYPWDVVAITEFITIIPYRKKDNKQAVIRISLPQLFLQQRKNVVQIILKWVEIYKNSLEAI